MRTIYIHIGIGKTGTTLVQNYLSQKRSKLMDQGVHYLLADDLGRGGGHQQFAKSFINNPPEYMIPASHPEQIRLQVFVEICASQSDVILLSSENFPLATVADVHSYFTDLPTPFNIKIILFVRSQEELAESEYNQLVKLKRETCTFATYAHEKLEGCDYFELASKWERHFGEGNMLCKIYNGARTDVFEQFLSLIPEVQGELISAYQKPDNAVKNVSLGMQALTAIRILNSVKIEDRKALYGQIVSNYSGKDLPALFFDSSSAQAFRTKFSDSNRAFTKRFLGSESDDLGGRRYSDQQRDDQRKLILELKLDRY